MARSRLLDQVRDTLRVKHYSIRTEESYIQWIKRFIYFHNKKHPADMGEAEITLFLLTWLSTRMLHPLLKIKLCLRYCFSTSRF